jgi:hypothetical protein
MKDPGERHVILFNVQKETMEVPRHFLNKSPYFLSIQDQIKDAKVFLSFGVM